MKNSENKKIQKLQKLLVLNRIKILEILHKENTCVCKMVEKLKLKHNLLSHHLKTLTDMGYIKNSRNGQHIIYTLNNSKKNEVSELLILISN